MRELSVLKKAVTATWIMMIGTILSKILGLARDGLIAYNYGTGMEAESYVMARTIPFVLFTIIAKALATVFIPMYTEKVNHKGKEKAFQFGNSIFNILLIFTLAFSILGIVFAPQLISLIAQGYTGEKYELTVALTRIMFPMVIFIVMANLFSAMLQSMEHFTMTSIAPAVFNGGMIIYMLFFVKDFGISGLAVATVGSYFLQWAVQYPMLQKMGYRFGTAFKENKEELHLFFLLLLPVLLGSAIQEMSVLIDRSFASGLEDGSVAALYYANIINTFAIGVFGASIVLAMFPYLSKFAVQKDYHNIKETLSLSIRLTLFIMIPVTVGFIVLGRPVVQILFERGAFGAKDTEMTTACLIYYSLGLTALIIRDLISRVYFAMKDTKTPMLNGVLGLAINVVLILVLIPSMSYKGLALSTSLSYIVTMVVLAYQIYRTIGELGVKRMFQTLFKTGLAAVIMGAGVYLFKGIVPLEILGLPLYLVLLISIGVILYGGACWLIKVEEIQAMFHLIRKRGK